ncbi:DUF2306 domain-containing protein [Reichenbachiella versicolor]|uniref:hypothetical protein n=1 Tax=Reichenbachiella versicolor TaxID=1821036 RepID=UPI000D6E42A7|nr:hypothetical protein [Reichenbachiella versicolor]
MEILLLDTIGMTHLVSSCFALIFGTIILFARKGTKRHAKVGYLYVISMAVLIATAFMIYKLFNTWGIFHYSAVVSLISIILGMVPIWIKRPINRWKYLHFSFMYWSVIGLYAAFAAEMLVRIPTIPFFGMVGIGTGVVFLIGVIMFAFNKAKWQKVFGD